MFYRRLITNLLKKCELKVNGKTLSTISSKQLTTIVVEGNIGSGKTTFLQHFVDVNNSTSRTQTQVFAEPIESWRNVRGVNLFQRLSDDINRWCFAFQSYVQLSMLAIHKAPPINENIAIKLMERSIYSARHCFVENLYRSGNLCHEEYLVLDEWYRHIVDTQNIGVDLIIYLRTRPEVVYDRILARNRNEEKNLSIDYLRRLHDLHEQWLLSGDSRSVPAPVLTIDANQDLENVKLIFDEHSQNILKGCVI